MSVIKQVKEMKNEELILAYSRMVEKVKRIIAMLDNEPMFPKDEQALVDKLKRLGKKYAHVENELNSRTIIMKQRVTALVDLKVGVS